MREAVDVVALLGVAAAAAGLAARFALSAPLLLTALGLVVSLVPGVPTIPLDPELVLVGLLPPLLYATAIRTPWVDLRRNRRAIGMLSVGLVLATAFAVAIMMHWLLPEVSFAAALALGAVVAPPDAVAASAVARRIGMPRGVVALLEGESLLNDATALVTLRTAVAAVAGSVSLLGAGANFVIAVLAGAGVGWVLAQVVSPIRRRLVDPVLDTSMSLLVPYVAYLAAEAVHGSGVLAVVVAGLMLGHRSTEIQSAASRVTERVIWRTVQFLLEGAVFLLLGLQFRDLLQHAHDSNMGNGRILLVCAAVLITVVLVRFVWVTPASYLPRLIPALGGNYPVPTPSQVVLVSWAGMRGVVTLAAALTLPEQVTDRDVLLLAAFSVVVGTLLIQGTTLPALVRWLRIRGPDPVQDALQQALLQYRAAQAAVTRLDSEVSDLDPPDVVRSLHDWGERVANAAWERLGGTSPAGRFTPATSFRRLRVGMLDSERRVVSDARHSGSVPNEIADRVLERVDQEEALLAGFGGDAPESDPDGTQPPRSDGCEHLRDAPVMVRPASAPNACPDCLALGERDWVHLRMCLACGHIGCCDSSPRRHADQHFADVGHPVMRSMELGESWRWCYIDAELG